MATTINIGNNTGNSGSIQTSRLDAVNANLNFGGHVLDYVGKYLTQVYKMLQRLDLSAIPAGSIITAATLYLYDTNEASRNATCNVNIYQIASGNTGWIEGTKSGETESGSNCWNKKVYNTTNWAGSAGLATAGTDYINTSLGSFAFTDGVSGYRGIPINAVGLSVLEGWAGTTGGDGWLLVGDGSGGNITWVEHRSNNSASDGQRPYLAVTYFPPPSKLAGWTYRKYFSLSRPSGLVTNYQMKILIGESAGAVGEAVDCGGNCKTDFSDLRFTNYDGTTLLAYWIEEISGTTPNQLATVWVEFDSIETTETPFYMYYGNAGAAAVSDGDATFILFDHFTGGTLDTAKWETYGTVAVTTAEDGGSSAKIDVTDTVDNAGFRNKTDLSSIAMRTRSKFGSNIYGIVWLRRVVATLVYADFSYEGAGNKVQSYVSSGSHQETSLSLEGNNYHIFDICYENNVHQKFIYDGTVIATHTTVKLTATDLRAGLAGFSFPASHPILYCDWFLIRKYLATEPAWGSWGAEEPILQHYSLLMAAGDFPMTGSDVGLKHTATLALAPALYSMIGENVLFPKSFPPFMLTPGDFQMSGSAINLDKISRLTMDPATYIIDGKAINPKYEWYRGAAALNYELHKQRRIF